MKVIALTRGGLTDVWKQRKKHGQNKFIVRSQPSHSSYRQRAMKTMEVSQGNEGTEP